MQHHIDYLFYLRTDSYKLDLIVWIINVDGEQAQLDNAICSEYFGSKCASPARTSVFFIF